ncbi:MAG TPA: secretin N-terminal domain-containing protein [Verrucomicrobiae bacterium]|nr:secretin N-terminal domain-containing protein [Verrucomicrobiae bacterium]
MKIKKLLATLLGTFLLQHAAFTQTNAVMPDSSANAAVAVDATNMPVPAMVPASGNDATNTPAMDASTGSPADATAAAPAVASIPLIQFQDVPITTAIENLARQAGINYLLDPKIGYGQPDANGQIKAEPTLSIRWENITAEHALVALLDNYGLQLVPDSNTKIYRITTKDPTAPPPLVTRVIQLKYASTSNMVDSVQGSLTDKRSRVIADNRTSQLIVVATDPEQAAVDTLINQLDKPTRQVLIETRLVEISSNPTSKKGIDWSGTLSAQNISAGNYSTFIVPPTVPTTTTVPGGTAITTPGSPGLVSGLVNQSPSILGNSSVNGFFQNPWYLNADGLHAVLSFLNSSSDAQVTSTPRVVTLDNEPATISVTRAFPVFNTTAGTQGSPGGSSVTYSNLGTILVVTPRISANDTIRLRVVPEVSSFFGISTLTVGGVQNQADIFDYRKIDTQVLIPNANTLVMGGMVKDSPTDTSTKVPVLGDIPGLGHLFRSETKIADKDNLLIFITPTIVQDTDFHPTVTDFLQAVPAKKKETLNPNSLWDGSKPYDWSNPKNTDVDQQLLDQKATQ